MARTQVERSATSRNLLLESAIAVLAEDGESGASIAIITARAGMSRGAVGFHFGSRLSLLLRVTERLAEQNPFPAPSDPPAAAPEEIVAWLGAQYRAYVEENSERHRAIVQLTYAALTGLPELRAPLTDHRRQVRDRVAAHLAPALTGGDVEAARRVADSLLPAWWGIEVTDLLLPDPDLRDRAYAVTAESFQAVPR